MSYKFKNISPPCELMVVVTQHTPESIDMHNKSTGHLIKLNSDFEAGVYLILGLIDDKVVSMQKLIVN